MGPCKLHGGCTPTVAAGARRRLLAQEASAELRRLGVAIETTPIEALEAMLAEAAGNVAVLRQMVANLPLSAQVLGDAERGVEGQDGIYGLTYHQSGVPTGEAKPHILVVMYGEERDRLAKLAEACAKLGLDERKVRVAEGQVERVFRAVNGAMATLPPDTVASFRLALATEMRRLTAGS